MSRKDYKFDNLCQTEDPPRTAVNNANDQQQQHRQGRRNIQQRKSIQKAIITSLIVLVVVIGVFGLIYGVKRTYPENNIETSTEPFEYPESLETTTEESQVDSDDNMDYDYPDNYTSSNGFSSHPNYKNFPSLCGIQILSLVMIQYGKETILFKHPWIVSLRTENKAEGREHHFCGGSLLSERIAMTAAHCNIIEPGIEMWVKKNKKNLN